MHVRSLPLPVIMQDLAVLRTERKVAQELKALYGSRPRQSRPRRRR